MVLLPCKGVNSEGCLSRLLRRGVKKARKGTGERSFAINCSYGKILRVFCGGILIENLFCR